ncbi:MAG: hypothetical protein NXI10_01580 [bacterium]|nr:hypothetical protein [bacterium]
MSFIGTISHAAHDISHAAHTVIHGVKSGLHSIENEASKLDHEALHELNVLKGQLEHLEKHLQIAELVNKTLHETVHDIENAGEKFAGDIKDLAEKVWNHVHDLLGYVLKLFNKMKDGEQLLNILHSLIHDFKDATREALKAIAILFDDAKNIVDLIDIDRFTNTLKGITSIWKEILQLAEEVPHLLNEAAALGDATKSWFDNAVVEGVDQAFMDKDTWVENITTFGSQLHEFIQEHQLPVSGEMVSVSNEDLKGTVELIPETIWEKVYHALHLQAVPEFIQHALKAMKSANFKRDMAIALAAGKSLVHWIKTIPEVLGVDADFDLIDFIKTKVGAGDASGSADGGGDGDTGGGFSVKFKAFSGMGAVASIVLAIINLFVIGGQLAVDLVKA